MAVYVKNCNNNIKKSKMDVDLTNAV